MSLFPAYALDDSPEQSKNTGNKSGASESWLKNDSFIGFGRVREVADCDELLQPINNVPDKVPDIHSSGDSTSSSSSESEVEMDEPCQPTSSKVVKRPHSPPTDLGKKRKHVKTVTSDLDNLHISLGNLGFIDVDPAPADAILKKIPNRYKKSKKKIMRQFQKDRYFSKMNKDTSEVLDDEETLKRTKEFNIGLRNNPEDVKLWLEYVKFQDCVVSESKVRAELKLSILEEAMKSNHNCPELTEEMFSVMETFSTPEDILSEAKKMILKDNKNLVAWHWMVNSSLFNITKLSVPQVLETFSLALEAHFRAFPNNSQPLLDTLLECCTFLRQCGLWEQLWMLVQLSLELNLSTPGSNAFDLPVKIDDSKIREMEDKIIVSGLPLGALWLRLEYLRSCVHYLPLNTAEDDPQRVVFSSDVASLLHPVHATYTSRLIVILLTSIKVPMIPMTQSAVSFIGLDKIPWAVESPEYLLAALAHPYLINQGDTSCLKICKELLVSPQCLDTDRPGSEEFFESTDYLFDRILTALDKDTALRDLIAIWKMRWYRLLGNRSKHAMKLLKAFPQNVALYTEYALLCYSTNDTATCLKVVERSLKLAGATPLLHLGKKKEKIHLAHLYTTYIEVLIRMDIKGNRNKILKLLMKLATGETLKEETLSPASILKLKQRFDSVTKEMVKDACFKEVVERSTTLEDIMMPSVQVSWFTCHAWFLYLIESPLASKEHMELICNELGKTVESNSHAAGSVMLEGCYEILISIIHTGSSSLCDSYVSIKKALQEASELYPNNLYILHVASSIDVIIGRWWSVSPVFLSQSSSVFVKLFTVFVYRQKMFLFQGNVSEDERVACQRKLYNLVRRTVTGGESNSRRCPLLWRLALQFVAALHPTEVKSTFYRALDLCPWVKSIYYDAAKMLPEEMAQIQDLIVEKELRIHITSEELEILREDGNIPGNTASGS